MGNAVVAPPVNLKLLAQVLQQGVAIENLVTHNSSLPNTAALIFQSSRNDFFVAQCINVSSWIALRESGGH
jgi:hypothetical protein